MPQNVVTCPLDEHNSLSSIITDAKQIVTLPGMKLEHIKFYALFLLMVVLLSAIITAC